MGYETGIGWCDATWSPWIGCSKVSPGCANCYAEELMDHRYGRAKWGENGTRSVTSASYWRQPLRWNREAGEAGARRRVFPSLCDPFEDRPELVEPRARLWRLIQETPNLDWLLLTKRPENFARLMREVFEYQRSHLLHDDCLLDWIEGRFPPRNVWIGFSAENQERWDERLEAALKIPAVIRFSSLEPLLGPIDVSRGLRWHPSRCPVRANCDWGGSSCPQCGFENRLIDWVIIGGESGSKARPCDIAWIRSIRDQCQAAGVLVFVKQLGSKPVIDRNNEIGGGIHCDLLLRLRHKKGEDPSEWPEDLQVQDFPKVEARLWA